MLSFPIEVKMSAFTHWVWEKKVYYLINVAERNNGIISHADSLNGI